MIRSLFLLLLIAGAVSAQPQPSPSPLVNQPNVFPTDGLFSKPPATPVPADGGLFTEPPRPKIWSGSFEAGLNGATGNSDLFNIRVGWDANRKTETNILHSDFLYTLGKQEGRTTQNTALFNARDEILFPGRRYTLFAATNIEYDELRAYNFRVGVYAGVGYIVIDDDRTLFKVRAGAGAVREIGGPKDRWVPELVFGYDFKRKITDRQSIVSTMDYYPRVDDFTQFRLRARIAYEVILDPETGTVLRLGAQSRYDSDPGPGFNRHDLNYFATFGMKF